VSPPSDEVVFVVDDDAGMRAAVQGLLRSAGLQAEVFASPREFLATARPAGPACAVLDVKMPGLSGLEVQRALAEAGVELPIIFITAHGDIPMTVQAIKAGALEFLEKPFQDSELLAAVEQALARDRAAQSARRELAALRARHEALTPREREVMALVVAGRLNKQIAADLGTSEITVKVHRGKLMRKMQAGSVAELVTMAARLRDLASPAR
jgi:FixJ family two-component response regulator